MTNSSEAPVSWDIWSNARFEGSTLFFVPACENGVLRISGDESGKTEGLDGVIVESAFTFVSEAPGPGKKQRYAKAFLHPEQGFVEIYKMVTSGGRGDLLELEHHNGYNTLNHKDEL